MERPWFLFEPVVERCRSPEVLAGLLDDDVDILLGVDAEEIEDGAQLGDSLFRVAAFDNLLLKRLDTTTGNGAIGQVLYHELPLVVRPTPQ